MSLVGGFCMTNYVQRRLFQIVPLLLGISIMVFLIIQAAPGGPETVYLASGVLVDQEVIEAYKRKLGLDQPIYVQYARWLGSALTGDMGYSYTTGSPVLRMIGERIPATVQLMIVAYTLAAAIAIPLGIFSAVKQYSFLDFLGTGLSFLGIAMPVFWFGLILQLIFSVELRWLPTAGRITVGDGSLIDQLKHIIMPATVLSLRYIAVWSRYMRSSMLNVIHSEYIRTARGKGLRENTIMVRHALKNALIPVVSVMALDLSHLFSGAVVTETIFAWPGIGRLFVNAMFGRDYPLLMGVLMMSSFMVVFFNLVADIIYGWLDPRINYE
jgi:peptide/nickel transport system permease protein